MISTWSLTRWRTLVRGMSLKICRVRCRIHLQICADGLNLSCSIFARSCKPLTKRMRWSAASKKRSEKMKQTKMSCKICVMAKSLSVPSSWARIQKYRASPGWPIEFLPVNGILNASTYCIKSSCFNLIRPRSNSLSATSSQLITTPSTCTWQSKVRTML